MTAKDADAKGMSEQKGQSMAGMNGQVCQAWICQMMARYSEQERDHRSNAGMEMGSSTAQRPFRNRVRTPCQSMPVSERTLKQSSKPSNPVHMHAGPQVDNVAMKVSERLKIPEMD